MKNYFVSAALLLALFTGATAAEQQVFGPASYDVKERYGKDNIYKETFRASEGLYLIKLVNGLKPSERPELLSLSVNGVQLLPEGFYPYPYLACIVHLKKENTYELNLKDQKPVGMKWPQPVPKLVTLTITSGASRFPEGAFGLFAWEGLKDFIAAVQKVKSPESAALAVAASNLQNDVSARAEAMRKLSDRKDKSAQDYIVRVYGDVWAAPDVRAEAALALGMLGDTQTIPLLLNGLLDTNERIRFGAARALSLYREEDTREPFTRMLERLDSVRKTAVIRAIAEVGWKPVGTLMDMANSPDSYVANVAIELLGSLRDPKAVDFLLKVLENPGARGMAAVITALGESKDSRAVEPLLAIAMDPVKRKGKEAELGLALANLGDLRAADVIREMAMKAEARAAVLALRDAYKRLTGKDL